MKKIGVLILLAVVLTACRSNESAAAIAHANGIIAAAHPSQSGVQTTQIATQGSSEAGHWQFLILILPVLFLVVPFFLVVFVFIQCLAIWKHYIWRTGSEEWIGEPNTHWKKSDEPDLYQQIQLDQQWLFSRLASQSQDETDQPELPIDWWG